MSIAEAHDNIESLIGADDPPPFSIINPDGKSNLLLVCDHASNVIPRSLGSLGLDAAALERHIAWDIGAHGLAEEFARRFEATLVRQVYSRLVIDCNRQPDAETSIVKVSEHTLVPGNHNLSEAQIAARRNEIFHPYHGAITEIIDRRLAKRQPTILLAMHSFTPVYKGESRPWHIGLQYNRDPRLAHLLHDLLAQDETLCIGDNHPYRVDDAVDYTIPVHGERRHIPHVLFELRHDMIEAKQDQYRWAHRLAHSLERALACAPELGTHVPR